MIDEIEAFFDAGQTLVLPVCLDGIVSQYFVNVGLPAFQGGDAVFDFSKAELDIAHILLDMADRLADGAQVLQYKIFSFLAHGLNIGFVQ